MSPSAQMSPSAPMSLARPVFRPAFRPGFSILPKKVAWAKKVLAPPWPSKISKKKSPSSPWPSEIFQFAVVFGIFVKRKHLQKIKIVIL
jgi:hypothetical protein